MATYDSLSAEDKAVVQNTTNLIRALAGTRGKNWNHQKAVADDSNAIALIVSLDGSEVIPNTSGLAGADGINKTELVQLWTMLELDRAANDTPANRALMSKAAGINALLG